MAQRIAYSPDAQTQLARGVQHINRLLKLTLGPQRGRIAASGSGAADLLDDASLVGKKVVNLCDSLEDVGHQILKEALERLYERTHDGVATCSVLTDALLRNCSPLLAFGHHPQALAREIRAAHLEAARLLRESSWPIDGPDEIAAVLKSATMPADLAALIAEIIDAIGPEGSLIIEETRQRGIDREYVRGARWNNGMASPALLDDTRDQTVARDALVLVTDCPLVSVDDALALLEAARGHENLLLIAESFSDRVVGLLLANRKQGPFQEILAVRSPKSVHSGSEQLEEIALLTGGRFITAQSGPFSIRASDFGRAGRVWASRSAFGIIEGKGDSEAVQQRASAIRARVRTETDPAHRAHLTRRAGNLSGVSALIRVGTGDRDTPTSRQVDRAVWIARQACEDGVVAGGGTALARIGAAMRRDSSPGASALATALAAPMATIVEASGREPASVLQQLHHRPAGSAFNVCTGEWSDARTAGLCDSRSVMLAALDVAVSTSLMILSTEVVVGAR